MMNMNRFSQTIDAAADVLLAKFAQVRLSFSDTDVKGGHNERIVASFVAEITGRRVDIGVEIFDTHGGRHSAECDIAVCNDGQPRFLMPLIAEGVDVVIQTKANINEAELKRAFRNCKSVKGLNRMFRNTLMLGEASETNKSWSLIPYYVVAFEGIKPDTLCSHATRLAADPEHEPDMIFVLGHPDPKDGYMLVNTRARTPGTPEFGPETGAPVPEPWVALSTGRSTLFELARALHTLRVPIFLRAPLNKYFHAQGYPRA